MNGPKRKKRVGGKPRLEMSALHRLATVFSAVWAVVAKLPAAEKQAACWAETWKAPAQVELMASSQGLSHVLAKMWRPPAWASAWVAKPFQGWSCPGRRLYPCAAPWRRRTA